MTPLLTNLKWSLELNEQKNHTNIDNFMVYELNETFSSCSDERYVF